MKKRYSGFQKPRTFLSPGASKQKSYMPESNPFELQKTEHNSKLKLLLKVESVPIQYSGLRLNQITTLELSNNTLQELESHIFVSLPNLVSLNAQRNRIKYVSGSIAECKRLKIIALDQNMLSVLPSELGSMP
jgi:Leucine-rich repeat (LRR) protein